jgi:hypothetical protein
MAGRSRRRESYGQRKRRVRRRGRRRRGVAVAVDMPAGLPTFLVWR